MLRMAEEGSRNLGPWLDDLFEQLPVLFLDCRLHQKNNLFLFKLL